MLLCDDEEEDGAASWSGSDSRGKGGSDEGKGTGGRSRRLLSLEQSKVLYKILEKVSSTHVVT